MESIKRTVKLQIKDTKKSIIAFWVIMLTVNIAFYLMNFYGRTNINIGMSTGENGLVFLSVVGSNLMAITIFLVVYSYVMYYETFPIVIGFSVTRKDFFSSVVIDNLLVTFLFALIQGILLKIDPLVVRAIGREPLFDFSFFNIQTDNIIFIIFSLFIGNIVFVSAVNVLAALNYKIGFKLWIIFGAIASLLMFTRSGNIIGNTILDFAWKALNTRVDLFHFLKLGLIVLICNILGYFITININIKDKWT
ncbi:MAG: hypothetical protein WDA24_01300 [Tissierellales bacterium]